MKWPLLRPKRTQRFRVLDAAAVADENSFWHTGAEELGYGMRV
jgi:hypothetical protein